MRAADAVRAAIADFDYSPSTVARSLKTDRHCSISVVVPDIMNPFFANLVRGIEAEARSCGHQVMLANSDESAEQEEGLVKALIQRIDGLIIGPIMEEDRSVLSLSQTGIPVVLVDRDATTTNYHLILVDNLSGTTQAIDHLVSGEPLWRGLLARDTVLPLWPPPIVWKHPSSAPWQPEPLRSLAAAPHRVCPAQRRSTPWSTGRRQQHIRIPVYP